jgi:hypothetical protein
MADLLPVDLPPPSSAGSILSVSSREATAARICTGVVGVAGGPFLLQHMFFLFPFFKRDADAELWWRQSYSAPFVSVFKSLLF